jgi:ribosomal protein S18 acetylase RimI-like enzyme
MSIGGFMMSVSFGVEFEFDYIQQNNNRAVASGVRPLYLTEGWDYQLDPTASSELRSPVFTSLQQYVDECNREFGEMVQLSNNYIPYMCNDDGRSLGQHMHVGKPNATLSLETKKRLARAIVDFYPLLTALHAQPIPSRRGLTTMYARSLMYYNDVISSDHYCEISDSHVGTVELRIFDSNIPQASLVNAFIVTEIAKKAFRSRNLNNSNDVDFRAYDQERSRALRYGLIGLNVTDYLRRLKDVVGNAEIPNIPAIREALFLMSRYRLNFYGAWRYSNVKPYDYFKAQLSDCSRFLENILTISDAQHTDKISQWVNEAQQIENLDQLIGLSLAVDKSLSRFARIDDRNVEPERPVERPNVRASLGRSEVRLSLQNDWYYICRINQVRSMSVGDVSNEISRLLTNHGDGMVNVLSAREVVETGARFYVFVAFNPHRSVEQICGAVAVHVRDCEIRSLVVDRRFRRLGIGRMLVEHAIRVLEQEGRPKAFTYVRSNNDASRNLFSSLGFKVREETDRSYFMVREFRSE